MDGVKRWTIVVALVVGGCNSVAPTTQPTPSKPIPTPSRAPTTPATPAAQTATAQPSVEPEWKRVESDAVDTTGVLEHTVSADDAVYATSSDGACPETCVHQVL